MSSKDLLGKKIRLRDWSLEDVESYKAWQKPGMRWKALDGPYYQTSIDESEKLAKELQDKIQNQDFPNPRMRLVIADLETNRLMGTVSSYWESKETNWLCVGISIYNPSDWGQGIGWEALGLWCDHLFSIRSEIIRLDMRTWSGNSGLVRLAGKLGFMQEACFRKARIVDGEYFDGLGFGILRDEWNRLYPNGFAAKVHEA